MRILLKVIFHLRKYLRFKYLDFKESPTLEEISEKGRLYDYFFKN